MAAFISIWTRLLVCYSIILTCQHFFAPFRLPKSHYISLNSLNTYIESSCLKCILNRTILTFQCKLLHLGIIWICDSLFMWTLEINNFICCEFSWPSCRWPFTTLVIMNRAVALIAPIHRVLLRKSRWALTHWFQVNYIIHLS